MVYAPAVQRQTDKIGPNLIKDKLVGLGLLGETFEQELNNYITDIRLGAQETNKEKQPKDKKEPEKSGE